MAAKVNTKVVARDRPMAVSIFLDTPINGHKPRNCTKTKLFTNIALMAISTSSLIFNFANHTKVGERRSLNVIYYGLGVNCVAQIIVALSGSKPL